MAKIVVATRLIDTKNRQILSIIKRYFIPPPFPKRAFSIKLLEDLMFISSLAELVYRSLIALKKSFVFLLILAAYFLYRKMLTKIKSSSKNGSIASKKIVTFIMYIVESVTSNPPFIVM